MKVATDKPFQIIYSLYAHEYLGLLFESFVVQCNEQGDLTLLHQNISAKNAREFAAGLDDLDYELIRLMDSIQQDVIIRKFYKKKVSANEFFLKVYDKEKGNTLIQEEIERYVEDKRCKIVERIAQGSKWLFEMGNDGEPTWRRIEVLPERATVRFLFFRNEDNTHYFPTIQYAGEKVEFQYKNAYLLCKDPAWMVLENKLYGFEGGLDGKKLQPFLKKKFIEIPKKIEDSYYRKFVAPLIAQFDVWAKGFAIKPVSFLPEPVLTFSELLNGDSAHEDLFGSSSNGNGNGHVVTAKEEKIVFNLAFRYGSYLFKADKLNDTSVRVQQEGDEYTFLKIRRDTQKEKTMIQKLKERGLDMKNTARMAWSKPSAFQWLSMNREMLEDEGFLISQSKNDGKRYFLGESSISIQVRENIDWFDIHAIIRFGDFQIPFQEIRRHIMRKQHEFKLPNGEIAVIPEQWFVDYAELFAFSEDGKDKQPVLRKHHLALVQDLQTGNLAEVSMSRKLEKLRDFNTIEEHPVPGKFKGELRPYQKAGYNWMRFLADYNFGGCLADDMGLGKTVQTLALLQAQKEAGMKGTTLLVLPTSLLYNWQMEARKFTPNLRVHVYTGTNRNKNVSRFKNYDLVLTSYGIVRLDVEELKQYYFNYVILDESQAIKNPTSNIAKAVRELNSRHRLILTGTPLENSTMDLWSQMQFINPGLLGTQSFFRNEFLNPIEKKQDEEKMQKLYSIIKPFILRRHKTQVATELPDKIETVQYCSMTDEQQEKYEEAKNYYRSQILDQIDTHGIKSSQFVLLQGLTKLRQIANHPALVDESYAASSGKMDDLLEMLESAISEGHKILIFSQFVKHLGLLRRHLDKQKLAYAYLDGATKDRHQQVERFQTDDKLRLFLISLKAGGVGLNLTKADYVFLLDPWWNPAIEQQAIDRAHRIGQVKHVFTYKFITKDTVEEKILALQQHKTQLADNLITTEESFVKTLSKEDISNILS